MAASWELRVAPVRAQREASLAKVEPLVAWNAQDLPLNSQEIPSTLLTPRELDLTEYFTTRELLDELKGRTISVEEVTRAFLRRAAIAQASVCHRATMRSPLTDNRSTASQSSSGTRPSQEPSTLTHCLSRKVPSLVSPSLPKSIMACEEDSRMPPTSPGSARSMATRNCTTFCGMKAACFMLEPINHRLSCILRPTTTSMAALLTLTTAT
jgi:hypothetical protein